MSDDLKSLVDDLRESDPVENPLNAEKAQRAADAIEALSAPVAEYIRKDIADAAVAAALQQAAEHAEGAWFFNLPAEDEKEPYRNAARVIRALITDDARAALDRIKAGEYARGLSDGMCDAAKLADQQATYLRRLALRQHASGIPYYEHNEWAARKVEEVAKDILRAVEAESRE